MTLFFADLSGTPVTSATIVFPYTGVWHADLQLDRVPIVTSTPLILSVAGMTLVCTAIRSIDFTGSRGLRVVGGMGGWRLGLPSKQYFQPFVSTVLLDAALSVQERIVITQDDKLDAFVRREAPASRVLQDLLPDQWWVDDTGTTQTIPRLATIVTSQFAITNVHTSEGIYELDTETPSDWRPGAFFANLVASGTINRVTHKVSGDALRTEVMVS